MYTIAYGNPVYAQYHGRSPKELEEEFPVKGEWVYHKLQNGTIEKWMYLGLWE